MAKAPLTRRQKFHKWFRLVGLLTLRKYGSWILVQLYFAFLVSEVISSMDVIWSEFASFQACQNQFISNITASVSGAYDKAARALTTSALDNTKCILQTVDVNMPSPFPDVPLSTLPDNVMLRVFGWISLPGVGIPPVNLMINTTTDEVVAKVKKDISKMEKLSLLSDYIGFILAGFSTVLILFTATWYTLRGKPWKPSRRSWFLHILSLFRIALFFFAAALIVAMQAYAVDKACGIWIDTAELSLPECSVKSECGLDCKNVCKQFANPCEHCSIKLHWWWVDWNKLPNIVGALYILLILTVWLLENIESQFEARQAIRATRLKEISDEIAKRGGKRAFVPRQEGGDLGAYLNRSPYDGV